jgi:arylsulfatase A-like enzyme
VVIIVLDAARADRFGCYGYPRDTTPNVDRLAKESVLFRNHFSTCSSTLPSSAALLTGLYPATLGVGEPGEIVPLDARVPVLTEALRAAGFRTALFSSNAHVSPDAGLDRGFQFFAGWGRPGHGTAAPGRAPEVLLRDFAPWLARNKSSRYFAYLHFFPPHAPYIADDDCLRAVTSKPARLAQPGRLPFPELALTYSRAPSRSPQDWADLYDSNLRLGDRAVGEVMDLLRQQGVLDTTLLVVTADHGEAFGEHGYLAHVQAVYDELVHIPLLIRLPGPRRVTGEVTALTQTVDVLPTICDLCQVPYRHPVAGKSLVPLLTGKERSLHEEIFAVSVGSKRPAYLVRDAHWALLLYRGGKLRALYDLQKDPGQLRNVIAQQPAVAARLIADLRAFARARKVSLEEYLSPSAAARLAALPPRKAKPAHLSEATRRELEALGYLH